MTQMEKRRLIKYALATYFSILAVFLFGFKMTTSIAFSAIFVISYGPTRFNCLSYSVHRMLAQMIGVLCGGGLHTLIHTSYMVFLPESQRMALAMTIGLLVVLSIKYLFHLDIAEFTMFTPVFLVLLMTPGNPQYPFLRVIYCLIGILIGTFINFLVFPCPANLWSSLDTKLHRENELLAQSIQAFSRGGEATAAQITPLLEELSALGAEIDHSLSAIRQHAPSKRRIPDAELSLWAEQHQLNAACLKMLRQLSILPPHLAQHPKAVEIRQLAAHLFTVHQAVVKRSEDPYTEAVFALPPVKAELHDLLLCESEMVLYYRRITDRLKQIRETCAPSSTKTN